MDVFPLVVEQSPEEVFVKRVSARSEVRKGEVHELRVVIGANATAQATVTVLRDGQYYGEQRLQLVRGDNVVSFPSVLENEGVHEYSVLVTSPRDAVTINNRGLATTRVVGEPVVLYVSDNPAPAIVNALASQGVRAQTVAAEAIPQTLEQLVRYEAVIFDNVAAHDLSVSRMEVVEQYVRDTGGGFLMLGGDASFGAGGYYRTPIERVLPVDMDVTSSMKIPSLAMVFVIDKSGSMGSAEVSGATKLDLVKEAVIASVEIMNPYYTVGLLAFDADFEWTVPLVRAGERQRIVEDLARLSSGGGTVLEGALSEAQRSLVDVEAAVKHLIVLSDGLTSDGEFEPIISRMRDDHITVTTVSIGSSSNRALMRDIAEWGGGRSYHTSQTSDIPQIFASETTIVSRNLIVEETFLPSVQSASPILRGIDTTTMPALRGFVLTYQKPSADQILSAIGANPLLSSWQYGLGRSAAFTSDLRAKWGTGWLGWGDYPQFVSQLVRWTSRERPAGSFDVQYAREGSAVQLIVDATDPDGSFRNLLDLGAIVRRTDAGDSGEEAGRQVDLRQVAPGRYAGEFRAPGAGSYVVTIVGPETPPQSFGYSRGYPAEYLQFSTDYPLLTQTARSGGGRVLRASDAGAVFEPTGADAESRSAIYRLLVLLAIGVLLIELLFKQILFPARAASTISEDAGDASPQGPRGGGRRRSARNASQAGASASESSVPSYEDVRREVARAYREESNRRADLRGWFDGGEHNPVAERKVHIARKKKR